MLLSFEKTQQLLNQYKIPLVESLVIENFEEGIEFAQKVGWPIVLKTDYQELTHRTDLGLVKLGVRSEQELKSAFEELKADFGKGRILAQKTASGVEMICGMKKDSVFGAFLIFGLGGIFVEVLKDISFAILPVNQEQAHRMITKLKGYSIFKGYRGRDPLYTEKVVELLLNVSELVQKELQIKEINFNPIFVNEKEVVVADAKITI